MEDEEEGALLSVQEKEYLSYTHTTYTLASTLAESWFSNHKFETKFINKDLEDLERFRFGRKDSCKDLKTF